MRAGELEPTLTARSFEAAGEATWRRDGPPAIVVRLRKGTRVDVEVEGLAPVRVRTDDPAAVAGVVDRLDPTARDTAATLPVPVDAWNRVLAQLGNLHEAGEQMAAARERAAVAETKVAFLKQQLAVRRHRRDPGLFGGLFDRG